MKAIQFKTFGVPTVLEFVDLPMPVASQDEMLVKVSAAGVNPIDYKIRDGSSFVAKDL